LPRGGQRKFDDRGLGGITQKRLFDQVVCCGFFAGQREKKSGRDLFCHPELLGQLYKIVVTEKPIGLKEGRGEISVKVFQRINITI
jgi:hypothetical protein